MKLTGQRIITRRNEICRFILVSDEEIDPYLKRSSTTGVVWRGDKDVLDWEHQSLVEKVNGWELSREGCE